MVSVYPVAPPQADSVKTYFEDLTHLLSLKVFTLTKSNILELRYPDQGRIDLRQNGRMRNFDLQMSYFGKRIGFDGFLQG